MLTVEIQLPQGPVTEEHRPVCVVSNASGHTIGYRLWVSYHPALPKDGGYGQYYRMPSRPLDPNAMGFQPGMRAPQRREVLPTTGVRYDPSVGEAYEVLHDSGGLQPGKSVALAPEPPARTRSPAMLRVSGVYWAPSLTRSWLRNAEMYLRSRLALRPKTWINPSGRGMLLYREFPVALTGPIEDPSSRQPPEATELLYEGSVPLSTRLSPFSTGRR